MATKWSCISHHSDESQKELLHARHAVLITFWRISCRFLWSGWCTARSWSLDLGNQSPSPPLPFLGSLWIHLLNWYKNHRFLHPLATSSPSSLFHCTQTQHQAYGQEEQKIHLCWRIHWRALHPHYILQFSQPQAWAPTLLSNTPMVGLTRLCSLWNAWVSGVPMAALSSPRYLL